MIRTRVLRFLWLQYSSAPELSRTFKILIL